MKKYFFAIIILFAGCLNCLSQKPASHRVYAELSSMGKPFSQKLRVNFDYGQKETVKTLVNDQGKFIDFNSMPDALNYAISLGWNFVQAYTTPQSDIQMDFSYHYIIYKDVSDESEITEGLMTLDRYKKK